MQLVGYCVATSDTPEAAQNELERLGFKVGQKLAERYFACWFIF